MRTRRRSLRRRYGHTQKGVGHFDTSREAMQNARDLGATHYTPHLSHNGWTFHKPIESGQYAGEFEQWEVTSDGPGPGRGFTQHGLAVVKSMGSRAIPLRGV